MSMNPERRSDPDEAADPPENIDQFVARVDEEFKQLDADIQKAEKEGEALKHEPEL